MMALYIDNAISWAQFRLRGGFKNLLLTSIGYTLAATFFIELFYQLADQPGEKMQLLEGASLIDLIFQCAFLLILGGNIVAGSLRRDITNHLIESHRLMPLSPVQAIVGYLAGTTVQILTLCLINFAIGAILFKARGIPVHPWLISNALLLGFSLSIWTAMAASAFVSRAVVGLMVAMVMGIAFSGGFIFVIAPGLLAFCSPMHGHTIFDFGVPPKLATGTVVALAAQGLVAILCIRAAARKYADAAAIGLTLAPALAALGIWAGLSWFGIFDFHDLRPVMLEYVPIKGAVLVVGAMATSMLVAILPLGAVAHANAARAQRQIDGDKNLPRAASLWLCLPVSLLFVMVPLTSSYSSQILYVSPFQNMSHTVYTTTRDYNGRVYTRTIIVPPTAAPAPRPVRIPVVPVNQGLALIALACGIYLIETYLLLRIFTPAISRARVLIFIIIVVLWFLPIMADVIYYGVNDLDPTMNLFSLYSPLGTIANALDHPLKSAWLGVAGQGAIAALIAAWFAGVQSRRRRKRWQPVAE
jgi:hypothetical protein